jgi:hypothetical protein
VIKVYPKQEVKGKKWLLNPIGALHHTFSLVALADAASITEQL